MDLSVHTPINPTYALRIYRAKCAAEEDMQERLLDAVQEYQTWFDSTNNRESKIFRTESAVYQARIESRRLQLNTCMADVEVARAAVVAAESFYHKDAND